MESVYAIPRADLVEAINDLTLMPVLKFEQHATVQQFIHAAQSSRHDLSDLLIAHSASSSNCDTVVTLDKKASGYSLFELA